MCLYLFLKYVFCEEHIFFSSFFTCFKCGRILSKMRASFTLNLPTFYPELARIFFLLLFLHFMACKYIGSVFAIVYWKSLHLVCNIFIYKMLSFLPLAKTLLIFTERYNPVRYLIILHQTKVRNVIIKMKYYEHRISTVKIG